MFHYSAQLLNLFQIAQKSPKILAPGPSLVLLYCALVLAKSSHFIEKIYLYQYKDHMFHQQAKIDGHYQMHYLPATRL